MVGWWLVAMVACAPEEVPAPPADDGPTWPVDVWNPTAPALANVPGPARALTARRAVFHLHSPFSHDACDGAGWVDGQMDTDCEADLRAALCDAGYDVAFITDHPDYGDAQAFDALFHARDGDVWTVDTLGRRYALDTTCPDGRVVQWRAGFEDELMPVSLHDHVDPDPTVRHTLLNQYDAAAVDAMVAAGGFVMLAHTEGRDVEQLKVLQDAGLHAVEAFNVHAMFDPSIRVEHLGLDGLGWTTGLGPFLDTSSGAQPDLLFLTVHQAQAPSLAAWDALLQRGPMMGTAGSDAHQNVLPALLQDGERVDSYRRTLRWFSTWLLTRSDGAAGIDEAVAARRAHVVFEALGTPASFDVWVESGGEAYEVGGDAPPGTLTVTCPTLADGSPYGAEPPEITVRVLRDGALWQEGCGSYEVERGVYRVEVEQVPHHLAGFLGPAADALVRPYPWIYSGAIRVDMP